MAGTIAPFPKHTFLTNAGAPAVGYKLFVYAAGTTTKSNTYTDSALSSPNANPIVLDASGRATIFLDAISYKFVLALPTDSDPPAAPIWTVDNVTSVPSGGANTDISGTAGEVMVSGDAIYTETGSGGTAGRWYLASNFTLAKSVDAPKLGIVLANATAGAAITVRIAGRVTAVGAVTPGSIYYLGSTSGKLETPAPNPDSPIFELVRPFAVADSATTLVFPLDQPTQWTRDAVRTFAYSAGQGSAGGGGDTELDSFTTYIHANYVDQPGGALVLEGALAVTNNGNAKTLKIKLGAGTLTTLWSSSAAVANHVVPFRFVIRRRTSTTASITGFMWAGAATAGAPTPYMIVTTLGAVDWTTAQNIALYASGTTASDVLLTDYMVYQVRAQNGDTV